MSINIKYVNEFSLPTIRHRLAEWIKKENVMLYTRNTFNIKSKSQTKKSRDKRSQCESQNKQE